MKKRNLKSLKLNKKSISSLAQTKLIGGEPEVSNWKYGYTCWLPDTLTCEPFSITLDTCQSCYDC